MQLDSNLMALAIIPGLLIIIYVYKKDKVEKEPVRLRIRDTDNGAELRAQIATLEELYDQFVGGGIREIY